MERGQGVNNFYLTNSQNPFITNSVSVGYFRLQHVPCRSAAKPNPSLSAGKWRIHHRLWIHLIAHTCLSVSAIALK
jgi:hypothetical protein